MVEDSPTVRRRELATVIRRLRLNTGLTVEQIADLLMFSASRVSRIETDEYAPTFRDVRDLCEIYGVSEEVERERHLMLDKRGKERGWWQIERSAALDVRRLETREFATGAPTLFVLKD